MKEEINRKCQSVSAVLAAPEPLDGANSSSHKSEKSRIAEPTNEFDHAAKDPATEPQFELRKVLPVLLIAGLGFMVDIYDVLVFAVVRVKSLTGIGVVSDKLLSTGVFLLDMQLLGMVIGGFIWGVIGDKKGRRAALFGSILLYSLANFFNVFVNSVEAYAVCRFIAGIGLAGEVGAAMTIAAEVMPPKYRAYGTAVVAGMGVIGSVVGSAVADLMPWRIAFLSCAVVGFMLLLVRIGMKETFHFEKIQGETNVVRGSIKLLFSKKDRVLRFTRCVLAAVPTFFTFGVLVSFAPEVCAAHGAKGAVDVAQVALFYTLGDTTGEVASCIISQLINSRKKAILLFVVGSAICTVLLFAAPASMYAILCYPLGVCIGVWSVIITSAAEQFGTNLRSTATTMIPNLARASAIPITIAFSALVAPIGAANAALLVGMVCAVISIIAVMQMEETFGRDLDFVEA